MYMHVCVSRFARENTPYVCTASVVSREFKQIRFYVLLNHQLLTVQHIFFGFLKLMETVFKCFAASRRYHDYGKTVWAAPKRGQKLYVKKETDAEALLDDKYAVAWMLKSKAKLVADVVGHVPQEISRLAYYFLKHGGSLRLSFKLKSTDARQSQKVVWRLFWRQSLKLMIPSGKFSTA